MSSCSGNRNSRLSSRAACPPKLQRRRKRGRQGRPERRIGRMRRTLRGTRSSVLRRRGRLRGGAPVATGRGGAVAAAEETAARVGIEILKKGGNATDAAVAVAFALAVTWPEAGNIGGGGFWISRDPRGNVLSSWTSARSPREPPAATSTPGPTPTASRPRRSTARWPRVSRARSPGLSLAHRRAGRLPWKTVVNPAVRLARDGFAVTEASSESIRPGKHDRLAKHPETARIFLPDGAAPPVGSVSQAARSRAHSRSHPRPRRGRLLPGPRRPPDRGRTGSATAG